ncbi:hypothetical protein FA13DRAFT_1657775 [Coprinellus micaceus]|uniref:BSD domain-containing protein n=1 Tax=Coprinellus micaceus TaxID=71717 RepID=A0A4Y7TT88_COPMI|nr:hypothetical protein FA13DRAFT_1657775 [Coprinellus micaceus]
MNFFDTYDIARAPTPQPSDANQPSLNEEFNEVVGQLGRFWGGFKRQSQQVLEVAKKDLGDVVLQAQKEIGKLTAALGIPSSTGDNAEPSSSSPTTPDQPTHSRSDSTSLFSRLQSALPPNLVSTVQSHIPESIKHASETIDLAQLSSTLKTEFTRVGGITRAQAEEYARKSEALVREAVREANEVLKDAVKIIPPGDSGEGGSGGASGMIWDGTDMWMLPTSSDGLGSARERASLGPETQTAVASRALALLHRLQSDPSIIQRDPEAEEGMRDEYRKWVEEEIKAKGGVEGPEWSEKTGALLKEEMMLYEMYTGLVPSTLSKEDFWSRYFFRAHQIKAEEDRRKALIQASAAESDEDFSWEDDEDENATAPTSAASPTATTQKEKQPAAPSASQTLVARDTSAATSPRSSDSFDVVSSTPSVAGGDSSTKLADAKSASATPPAAGTAKKAESDDDDDDDDEDEDEEDDDDEEDSDSDWE